MEGTKPQLLAIDAFRAALSEYAISERAARVLDGVKLVAVSGLAGGGRNTVISHLVNNYNYTFLISDTTRPPKLRDGVMEEHGVQYYFRSEEDVLADITAGEFLEAEIIHNQQVSGVSIRELERLKGSGRTIIGDFEYGGIANVHEAKPDTIVIGLLPPSYEAWVERLSSREVMSDDEWANRINTAARVLESMLERPYVKFVINNTVAECARAIDSIVQHDAYDDAMHELGRGVAASILEQIRKS